MSSRIIIFWILICVSIVCQTNLLWAQIPTEKTTSVSEDINMGVKSFMFVVSKYEYVGFKTLIKNFEPNIPHYKLRLCFQLSSKEGNTYGSEKLSKAESNKNPANALAISIKMFYIDGKYYYKTASSVKVPFLPSSKVETEQDAKQYLNDALLQQVATLIDNTMPANTAYTKLADSYPDLLKALTAGLAPVTEFMDGMKPVIEDNQYQERKIASNGKDGSFVKIHEGFPTEFEKLPSGKIEKISAFENTDKELKVLADQEKKTFIYLDWKFLSANSEINSEKTLNSYVETQKRGLGVAKAEKEMSGSILHIMKFYIWEKEDEANADKKFTTKYFTNIDFESGYDEDCEESVLEAIEKANIKAEDNINDAILARAKILKGKLSECEKEKLTKGEERALEAKKKDDIDTRTYKTPIYVPEKLNDNYVDCAEFTNEIAIFQGKDIGYSCDIQYEWFKKNGKWGSNLKDIKVGDFIYWDREKYKGTEEGGKFLNHVGIVYKVFDDGKVSVIQAGGNNGKASIYLVDTDSKGDLFSSQTEFHQIFVYWTRFNNE